MESLVLALLGWVLDSLEVRWSERPDRCVAGDLLLDLCFVGISSLGLLDVVACPLILLDLLFDLLDLLLTPFITIPLKAPSSPFLYGTDDNKSPTGNGGIDKSGLSTDDSEPELWRLELDTQPLCSEVISSEFEFELESALGFLSGDLAFFIWSGWSVSGRSLLFPPADGRLKSFPVVFLDSVFEYAVSFLKDL